LREHDLSDQSVLLIDDSRTFLSLMTDVLHGFGIRNIIRSTDAVEAFEIVSREQVDVALVDYEMPLINGLEFASLVRTAPDSRNKFLSMILVTGHSSRKIVMESIKGGFDDFLAKPMRPIDLYQKMVQLKERPKQYVLTPSGYFGPDRRRRPDPNFAQKERRERNLGIVVGLRDIPAITKVQSMAAAGNTKALKKMWEDKFEDLKAASKPTTPAPALDEDLKAASKPSTPALDDIAVEATAVSP